MAKAVCCDRCFVFAKAPIPETDKWLAFRQYNFGLDDEREILLCPHCRQEYEQFMAGVLRLQEA